MCSPFFVCALPDLLPERERQKARSPRPGRGPLDQEGERPQAVSMYSAHPARAAHSHGPRRFFDVVCAAGGVCELLAQLADEDVDDLQFRLVHAAIEVVEEISLVSVVPLRSDRSSSIWYSLPVK